MKKIILALLVTFVGCGAETEDTGASIEFSAEYQYECVMQNAYALALPIDIYYTVTVRPLFIAIKSSTCEVVDRATGAQLAIGSNSMDWCDVNYLGARISSTSNQLAMNEWAQYGNELDKQSRQYDECREVY